MFGVFKRLWRWVNSPSAHGIWREAFDHLQAEKKAHGRSGEYWRIWFEEVCPAYRNLLEGIPKFLRHPETDQVLHDMGKPLSERKYY